MRLLLLTLSLLASGSAHGQADERSQPPQLVDVFTSGVSLYPWSRGRTVCYRIPSLLRTNRGTLLAVVSERLAPAKGDWAWCSDESAVNIISSRSYDGGRTWEDASLIVPSGGAIGGYNGWTIQDNNTGRIFLFFNTAMTTTSGGNCDCRVSYVTSDDDGKSWSAQHDIDPEGAGNDGVPFLGSGLTSGITIRSSGRMVGCMRRICNNSCPQPYQSKSFYSDDHGVSWSMSHSLHNGTTECQIAELSDGRLYMTIRPYIGWNGAKDVRLKSYSYDDGGTWTKPEPEPALIDYGFAVEGSVVSDPDSNVLYYVHPHAKSRFNLTLYRSTDDGATWDGDGQRLLYEGSSIYSDAAVLDPRSAGGRGMQVGVLFERDGCGRMSFARVSYDDGDKADRVFTGLVESFRNRSLR